MSSTKIYTTVGIDKEVMKRLLQEAAAERRSRSFIVEKALRQRYQLPWERDTMEKTNADQT